MAQVVPEDVPSVAVCARVSRVCQFEMPLALAALVVKDKVKFTGLTQNSQVDPAV
jgi:hypothetical protein